MSLAGTWGSVATWEELVSSSLAINLLDIPNGNYEFYLLNLDNDSYSKEEVSISDGKGSINLSVPIGTTILYSTVKVDNPIKIGNNLGITT